LANAFAKEHFSDFVMLAGTFSLCFLSDETLKGEKKQYIKILATGVCYKNTL
jgi:hypothetical protein